MIHSWNLFFNKCGRNCINKEEREQGETKFYINDDVNGFLT